MLQIGPGLLLPMLRAGGAGADAYAVLGLSPPLVADFPASKFRTGGSATTFADMFTYAGASNKTMVDSDGVLKWAPHNLATYSKPVNNSIWKFSNTGMLDPVVNAAATHTGEIEAAMFAEDTSTGGHRLWYYDGTGGISGISHTSGIYVKANGRSKFSITFSSHSSRQSTIDLIAETSSNGLVSLTAAGSGWYLVSTSGAVSSTVHSVYFEYDDGTGLAYTGDGTSGLYVWGMHLYRSDLGGMVNNPDRGDSYVPTTSSAVYLPRRGHHVYNGSAWVNQGVLHESEARTNLVTYSEDFTDASWSNTGITYTATTETSDPSGGSGAYILDPSAAPSSAYSAFTSSSTTGTLSVFFKEGTERYAFVIRGIYTSGDYAIFDLQSGSVSQAPTYTGTTAGMIDCGNGWWRCWINSAQTTTINAFSVSGSATGTTTASSGYVYIYGAQLEAGSTPSSYIPTAGSTATRAAETLTIPAANLPYSATAMSIQMEGYMAYADEGAAAQFIPLRWYADANNYLTIDVDTDSTATGEINFNQAASGTLDTVASSATAYAAGINVPFNIASRHGSTFINGAIEGTALTADTTPTALLDLSATNLSLAYSGGPMIISKFRMWAVDLGDAGIEEAST